ncbi:hypothetical protein C8J46_1088 [Sphingomonas sp. PP-F2F-A104-K0414]|uniref:hypothetical protein n=1 Tax=Sphingomonas sp. PP-F2F-A104-K0414 TaxID=2135661 RepID=UPI001049665F|nr:hypothetical protein [Sphingomonas sp. PP-F2F-A104-K0414]TCP96633.1 hypothetical protein C8J46_1088 [Sphingomonas sp. PP-F2F-A104-K0414]
MTKNKAESQALANARDRLAPYIASNAGSEIVEIVVGEQVHQAIDSPWADKSVAFNITDLTEDLCEALNSVILPQRLSAVYHKDNRALEVIWTAYGLPDSQREVVGRSFNFSYAGMTHKCHFSRSSNRLVLFAGIFVPLKMSSTSFRNMQSFRAFSRSQIEGARPDSSISEPISFWLENIDWDPDALVELVNNLNFYLSYYDNEGPVIALHEEISHKPQPKHRYISGKFPTTIRGKRLDNNLLSFWEASSSGDPARRFQYYYRIIEYASFFYLESSARTTLKRILSSPDATDDLGATTDKLMMAFQMSKLDEYAKFSQLMHDVVDAKILWAGMKENLPAFSKDVKFDGGFTLKAIVAPTTKESTFAPKGVETFTKAIREIRNALSHGRDFKSAAVIMPTARNLNALQPWVQLMAVAAGQVVLYKDVA